MAMRKRNKRHLFLLLLICNGDMLMDDVELQFINVEPNELVDLSPRAWA